MGCSKLFVTLAFCTVITGCGTAFDAPKREITSVIVAPDGSIYAAGVGEKGRNNLPRCR